MERASGIFYDETTVRAQLEPHHDELRACVVGAWRRWPSVARAVARPGPSFRAHAMNELMIDEARGRFGDVPGVRIVELDHKANTDRIVLSVDPDVVVQFKKLDTDFRTRNYPTQRARAFDAQRPLPGIPPGCRVTVGYQLNTPGTDLVAVVVACQGPRGPHWWYELEEADQSKLGTVSPLVRTRVRPKPQLMLLPLPKAENDTGKE